MKHIGLVGLVALGGCTVALSPTPVGSGASAASGANRDAAIAGVVYSLPFAQFETAFTWKLKKCVGMDVEVELGAVTKVNNLPDPTKTFALDYRELASEMKTSKFELELHPNRMVKSFGTSATDQTGDVIVQGIKTVAAIAGSVVGFPGRSLALRMREAMSPRSLLLAPGRSTREEACTDRIREALVDEDRLKPVIAELASNLTQATERLAAMTSFYTSMGEHDERIRSAFLRDATSVRTLQEQLAQAKDQLSEVVKLLTIPQIARWPTQPRETGTQISLAADRLAKAGWFSPTFVPAARSFNVELNLASEDPLALQPIPDASPAQVGQTSGQRMLPAMPLPSPGGLYYRQPVEATLTVSYCKRIAPAAPQVLAIATGVCSAVDMAGDMLVTTGVPQFARLQFLPYANGPFQDNELKATFSEAGALVKVSYDAKSSALAAVKGAQEAATAIKAGIKDVREAGPAAQLADLKAQTDIAKQRKELANAVVALAPPKTDAEKEQAAIFETNTALKNAELANIKATQALADAKAKPSAQ